MTVHDRVTPIDLFEAVDEFAESNAEVMATLRHMFETGNIHFDLASDSDLPWAA